MLGLCKSKMVGMRLRPSGEEGSGEPDSVCLGEGLVSASGAVTRGSLLWWGTERTFSNELMVTILWPQSLLC